ncbi:DUF418 domain-containing protein [Glycomyces algeriensis]|uniref:DUF418 domain-containing protein n=1 Tax=Glycomyces algeriensis TaxID=256037 RepID=A0A9W6G6Y7_9ACTN|nr:DUF418 domain-containing protein [Glycomyces algeriensis]MDA1366330.1 DUF418 domain-containing protein [Glycomyces algeriensis]MDR7348676.1 putative membrane protein YeiB [Glycomyces algeriensis]GLI41378.1 hypothetical protein GALLR39Z86_12280 [Glycomyces algeriensis]
MTLSPPAIMSTPLRERSLAPDLARGLMLLLIALAHAHMFLAHETTGWRGYAVDGTVLDRAVAGLQVLLVDGRALPMFAALFGYGLARLAERRQRAGYAAPQVKRLVRRRSAWLLAFGFAHALLLFFGDILAAYGLIGLVFAGLLWSRDRTLVRTAWIAAAAHVLVVAALGASAEAAGHVNSMPTIIADPLEAALSRIMVWSALTSTFYVVSVLPAFALGIWAARRRLLDEPSRHLPLLRRTALWGIAIGVTGGLPLMLADTQLWHPGAGAGIALYALHSVTGLAAGLGYAALIALVATRPGRAPGAVANALAACGQRSLTCYLLQSVAFVALFTPAFGGLGASLGDAAASGVAVLIWAATVGLAAWMSKAGLRGPFEVLLRRLTYGRR